MNYSEFKKIFNNKIFGEDKVDLLDKISKYPERFVGLFRPTKSKAKIFQHLLQSHEIRFGDALEILITKFLDELGYENLPKRLKSGDRGFNIDQLFSKGNKVYFVEQKIRDDHDSTKKRGQMRNFEEKLDVLLPKYKSKKLIGAMYFIDPSLVKNKNYYLSELKKMQKDYGIDAYLFYGKQFFEFLHCEEYWNLLLSCLEKWKEELPEFPEINFDKDAKDTFSRLKDVKVLIWRKFIENEKLWEEGIVNVIFQSGESLHMIQKYFKQKDEEIYKALSEILAERINKYYNF